MSLEDRDRWNARYADGAYASRDYPSAFLDDHIDQLPMGDALDLACGAGRNARFLAKLGWNVTAVDVSDEGLARVVPDASAGEIAIVQADLDVGFEPHGQFDVILILRYLNLDLVRAAANWLRPGGMIVCEVLLAGTGVGPAESRFRAKPGQLGQAAGNLEQIYSFEGEIIDPDGRRARVAQLLALKY